MIFLNGTLRFCFASGTKVTLALLYISACTPFLCQKIFTSKTFQEKLRSAYKLSWIVWYKWFQLVIHGKCYSTALINEGKGPLDDSEWPKYAPFSPKMEI